MAQPPKWLPPLIQLPNPLDGAGIRQLHDIYKQDIKPGLILDGKEIWWNRKVGSEGCEEAFWHFITKGPPGCRSFDSKRAERLRWVLATIQNANDTQHVKKWFYREGDGSVTMYVWIAEFDYVLIFERRAVPAKQGSARFTKEILFLKSAYFVDGASTKAKFAAKYANRLS